MSTIEEHDNKTYQIRDRRGNNRYYVDNTFLRGGWAARVGVYATAVYNVLCMCASQDDQQAWPSYQTIASMTSMTRRKAIQAVAELERHNIIAIERRPQQPSVVTLLHPDCWRVPGGESDSPGVVNQIHQGGESDSPASESDSPALVNQIHPNKTQLNKTHEQDPMNNCETAFRIWRDALHQLQLALPRHTFDGYLRFSRGLALRDGRLVVSVADQQAAEWLRERLGASVLQAVRVAAGREWLVEYVWDE